MESLSIEKFNPTKAEIEALTEDYKKLSINGIDDKEGYKLVDTARKELKRIRVAIEKDGKSFREEAVAFQKAVIAKEKELTGLIIPIETDLQQKQKEIDLLIEIENRKSLLPMRKDLLSKIEVVIDDNALLLMDDTAFGTFIDLKTAEYNLKKQREEFERQEKVRKELEERERLLKEAEEKIKKDKEALKKIENDKRHQAELERVAHL